MAVVPAHTSLTDLMGGVVALANTVPEVTGRVWTVFNFEDIKDLASHSGFPVVGALYEGIGRIENDVVSTAGERNVGANPGNSLQPKPSGGLKSYSVALLIGSEYRAAGEGDTKPQAYTLLDTIRETILGAKTGNNTRPWSFVAELPLDGTQGVIWFIQRWQTIAPFFGRYGR